MANNPDFLLAIIKQNLDFQVFSWFEKKYQETKASDSSRAFFLAFGMVPRKTGNAKLIMDENQISTFKNSYPGFEPTHWTIDQLCRVVLMTAIKTDDNKAWLSQFFSSADMNEQVALYKGLYLLENANEFTGQAREGVRTNMVPVFDAIALNNPFADKYFDEGAWNQMVLKAIFMNRPIYRIEGLDERTNPRLTSTLIDFAHERWAAGRNVVPELWRLTKDCLDASLLKELIRAFEPAGSLEKEAILKMVKESDLPEAKDWMAGVDIKVTKSWDELGQILENQN